MICAKIHQSGKDTLLAACDSELLGKTIILDNGAEVKILESFYASENVSEEDLCIFAKECTTGNFFGTKTIQALINAGIINEESVMDLKGVPHSQLYKML